MSAPFSQVKRKAEDALDGLIAALMGSHLTSVDRYKGASFGTLSVPRIEVVCPRAEVEVIGDTVTGNYLVECQISVISHADDASRADHANRTGELEDILMRDDVVSEITNLALTDFTAFLWTPRTSEDTTNGDEIKTTLEGVLYCAPSTL